MRINDKMDINRIISDPGYSFLREDHYLGERIALLTFGGSISYGLNTPQSDIDIRGIIMPEPSDLLGCGFIREGSQRSNDHYIYGAGGFEQYIDRTTDTTLYVLGKIVGLFYKCNPNTIEMLGCRPEHYAEVSEYGQLLLDNRELFLSKLAYDSFAGYARGQFQRLKNAIGKDNGSNVFRCISLADSIERIQRHLEAECPHYTRGALKMFVTDKNGESVTVNGIPVDAYDVGILFNDTVTEVTVNGKPISDDEVQLCFSLDIDRFPAVEFNIISNEITSCLKEFNKHLGHRNHKKDTYHLNKHAMHLLRLYFMAEDILTRGEIITYREKEHDLLMSIKTGEYFNDEQNSLSAEFFDMVNRMDKKLLTAYENSKLPDRPDANKVSKLLTDINMRYLDSCKKTGGI